MGVYGMVLRDIQLCSRSIKFSVKSDVTEWWSRELRRYLE